MLQYGCAAMSCVHTCSAVDNFGPTHARVVQVAIVKKVESLISCSLLALLCFWLYWRQLSYHSLCFSASWKQSHLSSQAHLIPWQLLLPFLLHVFTTVGYYYCLQRMQVWLLSAAMQVSVSRCTYAIKEWCDINTVQSNSQGRSNLTLLQLFSFFALYFSAIVPYTGKFLHRFFSWILLSREIKFHKSVTMLHLLCCPVPTWIIHKNMFCEIFEIAIFVKISCYTVLDL